jgi:hypothetical protein
MASPSASVLKNLREIEEAAREFIFACKNAYLSPGILNTTVASIDGHGSDSNTALTEKTLKRWRDACNRE